MAIPTEYRVTHKCRHVQVHDLSTIPAAKRKSRANWLKTTVCTKCWRKENQAALREKDAQAANEFCLDFGLPPLEGSEKQLAWANIFRVELLRSGLEFFLGDLEEGSEEHAAALQDFREKMIAPAMEITGAGWWMTNWKDEDTNQVWEGEDALELVASYEPAKSEHIETENPF